MPQLNMSDMVFRTVMGEKMELNTHTNTSPPSLGEYTCCDDKSSQTYSLVVGCTPPLASVAATEAMSSALARIEQHWK